MHNNLEMKSCQIINIITLKIFNQILSMWSWADYYFVLKLYRTSGKYEQYHNGNLNMKKMKSKLSIGFLFFITKQRLISILI